MYFYSTGPRPLFETTLDMPLFPIFMFFNGSIYFLYFSDMSAFSDLPFLLLSSKVVNIA